MKKARDIALLNAKNLTDDDLDIAVGASIELIRSLEHDITAAQRQLNTLVQTLNSITNKHNEFKAERGRRIGPPTTPPGQT